MSGFYRVAYVMGFRPWERAGGKAAEHFTALLDQQAKDRPTPPAGEQVTGGLGPNFTVNVRTATYLGAMACHYLDAALMIAVSAWLLDRNLLPAPAGAGARP